MIVKTLIKKSLQRYWRLSRGLTLEVCAVLRDAAGRIVLVRAAATAPWRLPGGPVLKGESAETAATRLLSEQAAIEPAGPLRLFAIYASQRPRTTAQIVVFVVQSWKWRRATTPGEIEDRINLFHPDHLPETLEGASRERIGDIVTGRQRTELW